MVFDDKGRIAAIRHHWLFDEEFSAYALQGLDTNRDGKYSAEELKPLAKENVESLKDYDYFTFLSVGDYQAGFADADATTISSCWTAGCSCTSRCRSQRRF